jgi:hypothetical protein
MDAPKQDVPVIHPPSVAALVQIACEMRHDWDPFDLRDAVLAASGANWDPLAVTREVWRLANDPKGEPAELRNSARRPATGPMAAAPGDDWRAAMTDVRRKAAKSARDLGHDGSAA